jgi:hypothetical protein
MIYQDAKRRVLEMSVLTFIQLIATAVIHIMLLEQGHQIATALDYNIDVNIS